MHKQYHKHLLYKLLNMYNDKNKKGQSKAENQNSKTTELNLTTH